jgi:uncharacterized membrane protein
MISLILLNKSHEDKLMNLLLWLIEKKVEKRWEFMSHIVVRLFSVVLVFLLVVCADKQGKTFTIVVLTTIFILNSMSSLLSWKKKLKKILRVGSAILHEKSLNVNKNNLFSIFFSFFMIEWYIFTLKIILCRVKGDEPFPW